MPYNKISSALFLIMFFNVTYSGAGLFSKESKKKYEADIRAVKIAYDKGDCFQVIEKVNEFLESKPPSYFKEEAYTYLGSCYEKRNEIDKALDIYGLANTLYSENNFFRESLANIYLGAGFFEKALVLFKEFIENENSSYKAYAGLAKSYASLGFYKKARKNYSKALEMSKYKDLNLVKEYSRELIKTGYYSEAFKIFEVTSPEFKKDAEVHLILSRVYMYKEEYDKALSYINAAQKIAPNRRDMALYGIFLNIMTRDYDKALSEINNFTNKYKEASLALLAQAIVNFKKDNKEEGYKILRKISRNKESFVSKIALAMLKEGKKSREKI